MTGPDHIRPRSFSQPVIPSKIVCLARSFRLHAEELGNDVPQSPLFFLKATSALIGPGDAIRLPSDSTEIHHEAEVAMVVGQTLRAVDEAVAMEGIASWTILNDITARDLQRSDKGRFTRAKGYDTFCPLSDVRLETLDWAHSRIQCYVDGEKRQDGGLSDLIFSPARVLASISKVMTLVPGDIISLGTPAGVGPICHGNVVEVRLVDGKGTTLISLKNPVRRENTS